jgi:hypothetical protein
MSKKQVNWFKRNILYKTFFYRMEECGNMHGIWERLCFCNVGESWKMTDPRAPSWRSWHGGIRDLKTGAEYFQY